MHEIRCAKPKKTKGVLIWPSLIRPMNDGADNHSGRTPTNLRDVIKKHAHIKKGNITTEKET